LTRPGYKMTEIGEMPEGWEIKKLEDEVYIMDSRRIPLNEIEREQRKGPFPYCGANGIVGFVDNYIFNEEAILLAEDGGNYGKFSNSAYLMNGKYWVNNHAHIIKAKVGIANNKYVLYWLNYFDLSKYVSGTTRAKLNQEKLRGIPIPGISLPEQQKIAEILSTADETIQKINEQISLTERLKKGLMQTLLTKGIGHTKFKITEVGEIPENWKIEKISKLTEIVTGGTPSTTESSYWNGKIPWIASGDVNQHHIRTASKFITEDGYLNSNCKILPVGTVLIALNGQGKTRGMSAILEIEAVCNQSLAGIIPKRDILSPLYLLHHLLNRYLEIRNVSGTGRNGLNLGHIKSIVISCPPLDEQQKIAEILTTVDNKLELLRNKRDHLEKLKKGLMNDLLTGKVRVNQETLVGEN
jgi:type I restriction enzyme S subunit